MRVLGLLLEFNQSSFKISYKTDSDSSIDSSDWVEFDKDGSSAIAIPIDNSNDFIEVELEHLPEAFAFSSYQIKIEMFSNNPAIVPLVSGLRVITGIS